MDDSTSYQNSNPYSWQGQVEDWTKKGGLQNYVQSGLGDSTIGKSGFFDKATAQGQALRAANLQQAQQIIGAAPVAGINPAQAVQAGQAAQAQGMQQRQNYLQSVLGGAQANQQSTTQWINQMMGAQSNMVNANKQDWQNYQQAALNAATNNAASKNASAGAMYQAGGEVAGAVAAVAIVAAA